MTIVQEPPITPTPEQLVNNAIELLQAIYPNWKPNPASPEYRMLLAFAAIASETGVLAVDVPEEIISFVGAVVYRTQVRQATRATVKSLWTANNTNGETIEAGTEVFITMPGGTPVAFEVKEETVIPVGKTEAAIELVAINPGEEGNGLTAAANVVTSEPLTWVSTIVLTSESGGGKEEESFEEYLKRILELAALITPRPILGKDFANYVRLLTPSGEIARAVGLDEYNPETKNTFTGTTTEKSNELKEISSFTGLTEGSVLVGAGIPTNTVIVSVNEGAKTAIMSSAATATHSKESIEAVGSFKNERCVTVGTATKEGLEISAGTKTEAEELLKAAREASFKSFVIHATYTEIEIKYKGVGQKGFKAAVVEANVRQALENLITPAKWGTPPNGDQTQWLNARVLRYQDVITALNNTLGFDHYTELKVNGGEADINLAGVAPLTKIKGITGSVEETV